VPAPSTTTLAPTATPLAPTTTATPTTAAPTTTNDYDYRQDDENILNHMFASDEACLIDELSARVIDELQLRPMTFWEQDSALRCTASPEDGSQQQPGHPESTWNGPRPCISNGVIFQPPAFGVAPGLPVADPTAALLDDGRIRLYLLRRMSAW
jgi:hypothetical protein